MFIISTYAVAITTPKNEMHSQNLNINEEKPDLIGISVLSFNYPEALEIARYIKSNFDIKIIFGGVHVILTPEEVIQNNEPKNSKTCLHGKFHMFKKK